MIKKIYPIAQKNSKHISLLLFTLLYTVEPPMSVNRFSDFTKLLKKFKPGNIHVICHLQKGSAI